MQRVVHENRNQAPATRTHHRVQRPVVFTHLGEGADPVSFSRRSSIAPLLTVSFFEGPFPPPATRGDDPIHIHTPPATTSAPTIRIHSGNLVGPVLWAAGSAASFFAFTGVFAGGLAFAGSSGASSTAAACFPVFFTGLLPLPPAFAPFSAPTGGEDLGAAADLLARFSSGDCFSGEAAALFPAADFAESAVVVALLAAIVSCRLSLPSHTSLGPRHREHASGKMGWKLEENNLCGLDSKSKSHNLIALTINQENLVKTKKNFNP